MREEEVVEHHLLQLTAKFTAITGDTIQQQSIREGEECSYHHYKKMDISDKKSDVL